LSHHVPTRSLPDRSHTHVYDVDADGNEVLRAIIYINHSALRRRPPRTRSRKPSAAPQYPGGTWMWLATEGKVVRTA